MITEQYKHSYYPFKMDRKQMYIIDSGKGQINEHEKIGAMQPELLYS